MLFSAGHLIIPNNLKNVCMIYLICQNLKTQNKWSGQREICDCPSELVHTSKFATSMLYNFGWEKSTELKFAMLVH